ncbi:MAG: hypothetical protein Q9162_007186 [Coniocarpon cinnabarinum]
MNSEVSPETTVSSETKQLPAQPVNADVQVPPVPPKDPVSFTPKDSAVPSLHKDSVSSSAKDTTSATQTWRQGSHDHVNGGDSIALPGQQPAVPPKDLVVPRWPDLSPEHPISKLALKLPDLIAQATYTEVYGLEIDPSSEFSNQFSRNLILQKFLRANANDVDKAAEQLLATLKWRKEFNPLSARDAVFNREKFDKLGYVTKVGNVLGSPNASDLITFNIYGAVTDKKSTFGDTESFLRWRVALMEISIQNLNLAAATEPIPDYGKGQDPFLRQDPHVKAASSEVINTFKKYYPETLSRKFFVNVPTLMGWMFGVVKMLLNAETIKKFTILTNGTELVKELGEGVPEEYGGKGGKLAQVGIRTKTD